VLRALGPKALGRRALCAGLRGGPARTARYGEKPHNRLQPLLPIPRWILKPQPRQTCRTSTWAPWEAIGLDTRLHDIRFVERRLGENPTVGAWGLGLGGLVRTGWR